MPEPSPASRSSTPPPARSSAASRPGRPTPRTPPCAPPARRVREHADELAELQSREGGKPLGDSRGGVEAGLAAIEQYAELGPLHRGRALQGGWDAADLMVNEPRGVVALLVPWNDPIAIACGQIAAALVTGNTVVYKPSEKTPLSGARLVELLDLPGKDAMIVDAGVEPEWAAEQAAIGAFANAGQLCTSVERIFVHRQIAEPFVDALARRAAEMEIGPLIDEDQRDWVHNHVEDACHNGARLVAGGEVPDGPGCFYPPTVLVGPPGDSPVLTQETFGPVAAVRIVNSFGAALEEANRGEYGLAAVVLTPSHAHAQRAWRELDVGTVKV